MLLQSQAFAIDDIWLIGTVYIILAPCTQTQKLATQKCIQILKRAHCKECQPFSDELGYHFIENHLFTNVTSVTYR